jgi:hypothetical protein
MSSATPLVRKALVLAPVENHGTVRCGFISLNVPGGFELAMPRIVQWLAANPLGMPSPKDRWSGPRRRRERSASD